MGPLGPLLHVEKFVVVVVVGGGGWVCKAILVIILGLLVQADQSAHYHNGNLKILVPMEENRGKLHPPPLYHYVIIREAYLQNLGKFFYIICFKTDLNLKER